MADSNGEAPGAPLDLRQVLEFQMEDGAVQAYEVTAIIEDTRSGRSYAVLQNEEPPQDDETEVIVTDLHGNLLEDEELVEEILAEYEVFNEEAADDGGAKPE